MSIKPMKVLLLVGDGCKDPIQLQKAINDGRSFKCDLVSVEHLKETLQQFKKGNPKLILLGIDRPVKLLANTLSRVREIAIGVPVLVLPEGSNGLGMAVALRQMRPATTWSLPVILMQPCMLLLEP
jgi:hypothetical protein